MSETYEQVERERDRYRAEANQLRARLAEGEKLRSALERLRGAFGLILSGKPCRDVEETLAEVDAALASGRVKEGEK